MTYPAIKQAPAQTKGQKTKTNSPYKMTKQLSYEIRTSKAKAQGVFATREISLGAIFMAGALLARADRNSEATVASHMCKINHHRRPNAKCYRNKAGRMEICALGDIERGEEITLSRRDVVALCAQPRSLSLHVAAVFAEVGCTYLGAKAMTCFQ